MASVRFLALVSTVALVVGALQLGEAIHGSVVTGQHAVTSPWVAFRAVTGLVLVAVGYRFRTPADEYVATPSDEIPDEESSGDAAAAAGGQTAGDSSDGATGQYDPELSPLGEDGLTHVDADPAEEHRPEAAEPTVAPAGRDGDSEEDDAMEDEEGADSGGGRSESTERS